MESESSSSSVDEKKSRNFRPVLHVIQVWKFQWKTSKNTLFKHHSMRDGRCVMRLPASQYCTQILNITTEPEENANNTHPKRRRKRTKTQRTRRHRIGGHFKLGHVRRPCIARTSHGCVLGFSSELTIRSGFRGMVHVLNLIYHASYYSGGGSSRTRSQRWRWGCASQLLFSACACTGHQKQNSWLRFANGGFCTS